MEQHIVANDKISAAGNKPQLETTCGDYIEIPIERISPNPNQPREKFDNTELARLAQSIKEQGLIQPLLVQEDEARQGYFVLIAGERRLRACQLLGFSAVSAIVKKSTSKRQSLLLALVENIQRQDLNVIEEAKSYLKLVQEHGLSKEECGEKLGKDRSTIANFLRLLQLPLQIQDDLAKGVLSMGHGKALCAIKDKAQVIKIRDLILKKQLSVRESEKLCSEISKPKSSAHDKSDSEDANLSYIADTLREHFRTKVRISGTGGRGKIEISYFSPSELERLLSLINCDG